LALVTFSPLSVIASNKGIGLFAAAPAHSAANREQAVEAMTHMIKAEDRDHSLVTQPLS
jgi:hypothetical protein